MFTIKFYRNGRQRILSAESFTILRDQCGGAEITLHRKNREEDVRYDISLKDEQYTDGMPETFQEAIIENAAGKTTEIVSAIRYAKGDAKAA